jgi:uncharacterized membrane protein YphA (DoxX/SURF4 family)
LVLRLALGVLFTWAGLVKWFGTFPVQGDDAAILANMGLIDRPSAGAPAAAPTTAPSPANPLPPAPKPGSKPHAAIGGSPLTLAQTTPPASIPQTTPSAPAGAKPAPPSASPSAPATAAEFPEPVQCRGAWMIALAVHHASHPEAGKMALWPRWLGDGTWPGVFAVVVLACEFGGGVLVLLGLFTRLGALAVMSVMLGAMWLTQFGPAMQSGSAVLGFLPDHGWKDGAAWQTLIVQGLSLASAIALVCLGSGALAVDRVLSACRTVPPSRPAPSRQATDSAPPRGGAGAR